MKKKQLLLITSILILCCGCSSISQKSHSLEIRDPLSSDIKGELSEAICFHLLRGACLALGQAIDEPEKEIQEMDSDTKGKNVIHQSDEYIKPYSESISESENNTGVEEEVLQNDKISPEENEGELFVIP